MCCWESTACSRYTIVIGLIDASCFDTSALHFDAPSIAQPRGAHQRRAVSARAEDPAFRDGTAKRTIDPRGSAAYSRCHREM